MSVVEHAEVFNKDIHLCLRLTHTRTGSQPGKQSAAQVFSIAQPILVWMN